MRLFERTFSVSSHTRILDVGGSPAIWQFLSSRPQVTILNFPSALEPGTHGMELVAGDGCQLPFPDRAFDIVFSNSVIEHVGGPAAQKRFAEEIMRTGKRYWVQTPDRSFPVEPHLMVPFLHYFPKSWQATVVRRFTIWEWLTRPTAAQRAYYLHHCLYEMHLLNRHELQAFFPGAQILSERFLGLSKSLIAVGDCGAGATGA
jgi:SAM-dependent methyltransferase